MSIGLGNGLAPIRRQAIMWTNADPVYWCIYAALEGDKLIQLIGPCTPEKFEWNKILDKQFFER